MAGIQKNTGFRHLLTLMIFMCYNRLIQTSAGDVDMLNRENPIPLYVQLYRILKQDITNGIYKDGEMIPSEAQLMNKYCVTRTTIRKAVSTLAQEGLVETLHGKGTVVSLKELKYNVWNFSGFTDYLRLYNEVPESVVIENKMIKLDGTKYYRLVRGRGVNKDGQLLFLTLDDSLMPAELFPNLEKHDFSIESLYHIMMTEYNIIPDHVKIRVIPIQGNKLTEKLFKYDKSNPLLKVEGSMYADTGVEIEKIRLIYSPNMNFNIVSKIGGR